MYTLDMISRSTSGFAGQLSKTLKSKLGKYWSIAILPGPVIKAMFLHPEHHKKFPSSIAGKVRKAAIMEELIHEGAEWLRRQERNILERVSVPNVTPSSKAVDVDIPAALKSSLELFGCKFNTHVTSEFHCEAEKTVVDLETEEVPPLAHCFISRCCRH